MDKDKKQQVILIVLIPVFLLGLIYMRAQQKPKRPAAEPMGQVEADTSIDVIPAPKDIFDSVYTPSKEDPFKNLLQQYFYQMRKVKSEDKTILSLPVFTIEGIIWNTNIPQAIVNGQVVRIGDIIDGFSIMNIEKQGITIDYQGESVLIKR